MGEEKLSELNGEIDKLVRGDCCMRDVLCHFTLYMSTTLGSLKTAKCKSDFCNVYERLLRYLIRYHIAEENESEGISTVWIDFFASSILHLHIVSAPCRRLLAQVLKLYNLYPSCESLLRALLTLLDTHHQKYVFETLTSFLCIWIANDVSDEYDNFADERESTESIVIGICEMCRVVKFCHHVLLLKCL